MENNNDKKIKIYVTLLLTVICIIGVSYAYFRLVLSQTDNNSLASRTCFSTTLTEQTSKIALTDVYPVTDEEGIKGTPYTFTIKNNCTGYVKATITIDSEYRTQTSATYLNDNYVKVNLSKSDVLTQGNMHLGKQELVDLDNSRKGYKLLEIKMGPNQEFTYDLRIWLDADTNLEQGLNKRWEGKIVAATVAIKNPGTPNGWNEAANGTLLAAIRRDNPLREPLTKPGVATSYSVADKFPDYTSYANAYFTYGDTYKVNADGTYTIENPKKVKYSDGLNTLKGKYMVSSQQNYSDVKSTTNTLLETTNKKQLLLIRETSADGFTYSKISGGMKTFPEETEAVMASTQDDYGTSYYFRGVVENNYVEFANKCWRIVRVTGDGSIKLALFNNNTDGKTNPCAEANDSEDAAIVGGSQFNYALDDNAFAGLMYGNVGCSNGTSDSQDSCTSAGGTWSASTSYANAHANINKSTILKYLEEWYDNNIVNYDSYIADTIWCNDKSTVKDTTFNPFNYTLGTNYGYGLNINYYGADKRLFQNDNILLLRGTPSLICPNDDLGGKLSKYTVSDTTNGNGDLDKKLGLLTADEIAYAGGENGNFSYYLSKNAENWWWTISPSSFDDGCIGFWYVYGDDGGLGSDAVDIAYNVRPSLSLKSTVPIASGKGTRTSPYVVE